jgi:hypothetical protein
MMVIDFLPARRRSPRLWLYITKIQAFAMCDWQQLLSLHVGHAFAFPRRIRARIVKKSVSLETEGAGKAGRSMHPQPRVEVKKPHECSHHRFTGTIRPSLREWF